MKHEIWAAEKSFLTEYAERLANATAADRSAAAAQFSAVSTSDIMTVSGDTAVINIEGVLSKNGPSALAKFFGFSGASYIEIAQAVTQAAANDDVKTIQLNVDSPGGRVNGVDESAQAIADAAKVKPVVAVNTGMIASAAYLLASQATKIVATSPMALTGSIGVVVTVMDDTDTGLEAQGKKRIQFVSSGAPNKTHDIDSPVLAAETQQQIDAMEAVFIARVAEGRNVTAEKVRSDFGQGGMFIAQDPTGKTDAISAGLIDALVDGAHVTAMTSGLETSELNAIAPVEISGVKSEQKTTNKKKEHRMLKEFLAENPQAQAEFNAALKDAETKGASAEQEAAAKRIELASKFIGNDSYHAKISECAVKVAKGERSMESLDTLVDAFDMRTEETHSEDAAKKTDETGETPGGKIDEPKPAEADGVALDNDGINAMIDKIKEGA